MKNIKNSMSLAKKAIACLLVCISLALCACGNNRNVEQSSAAASADLATAEEKQVGGELFIAMPADISSLNPLTATDEDLVNLLGLIYEPAIRIGTDGKPEESLIESWETDESGREYTLKVRSNVTFSDGTPLTAEDIVYSAQQVGALTGTDFSTPTEAEPQQEREQEATEAPEEEQDTGDENEEESASSETIPPEETNSDENEMQTGEEEVVIPQTNRYAQYNTIVESIEVVDTATVKLTMTKPGMEALYFLNFPVFSQSLNEQGQTIGTGPYRIESFESGVEMVLTVNENWWNTLPNIPRIVAKPVVGSTAKLEAVSTSVLDLVTTDVLYAGNYKSTGKTKVVDYMTNYYDCLIPNLSHSALGITEVRQAISYAIDRKELISTVLLGHGIPANMPISPDFYAYDPAYKQDDNIKTARSLLETAGFRSSEEGEGNILSLSLIVPNDRNLSYRMEAAKAIRKQLGEVGIEVNVETLPQQEYYARLQARNFDLAFCSFYLDSDPDISFMFSPGGSGNYGGVDSAEITAAIDSARAAFTEETVKSTYSELQKLLIERMPQIGLYFRTNSIVCNDLLMGIGEPLQGQIFADINTWYYKKS